MKPCYRGNDVCPDDCCEHLTTERSRAPLASNVEVALTDLERYCSGSASALHSIAVVDAEIERLELRCAALLEAECDKRPAVTERDRLRAALDNLVGAVGALSDPEDQLSCIPAGPEAEELWQAWKDGEAALSGEPGSGHETNCAHEWSALRTRHECLKGCGWTMDAKGALYSPLKAGGE